MMSKFLFCYRVPDDIVPGGTDVREAWSAWFDGLGAHLVDRGNPVFESTTVGGCPTGTSLGGYSVLDAPSLEAAVELARGCPGLQRGFGVEVGVLTLLNPWPAAAEGDQP